MTKQKYTYVYETADAQGRTIYLSMYPYIYPYRNRHVKFWKIKWGRQHGWARLASAEGVSETRGVHFESYL